MNDAQNSSDHKPLPAWGPRGTAAAMFAARLSFENVSHNYGSLEAVNDISFELKPGEIVCLLGPSGCGKTTLLRLAAGIEAPKSGRVLLDGQVVSGGNGFVPPERRNVGLMFQDFALFPHLTIVGNVAFGLHGLDRPTAMTEAKAALRRVGMENYAHSYPHVLSGGEQQRVALARAIVPRPAVMLMDEPFSGLDQRLRNSVRQETLALLRETRASTLLVTHDPEEALGMADRILLMRSGHLVQSGTPEELYKQPADAGAARFFSEFNEFSAIVHSGTAICPIGEFAAAGFNDGEPVTIFVRQQGIRPVRTGESGLDGRVLSSRFLGDQYQLEVQFAGLDGVVVVRTGLPTAPQPATIITFTIDHQDVLVFASGVA